MSCSRSEAYEKGMDERLSSLDLERGEHYVYTTESQWDKLQTRKNDDSSTNKYKKSFKGVDIDVYDVLVAFEVQNPAIQHAVKKMLCAGQRGYKTQEQDINEAIQSLERAKEL
jgi:hypothetical protein